MVETIDDMWSKLSREKLPAGFNMMQMKIHGKTEYIISIRLEEMDDALGLPIIRRSMTIYPDLHFRLHVARTEVQLSLFF